MRGIGILFNHSGCLGTIHVRQTEIHEYDIRMFSKSTQKRFSAVRGLKGLVSHQLQIIDKNLAAIGIIFNDENFFFHYGDSFREVSQTTANLSVAVRAAPLMPVYVP